jgi:hypothetical protein
MHHNALQSEIKQGIDIKGSKKKIV